MKSYIERLKACSALFLRQQATAEAEPAEQILDALHVQISRWWNALPVEVRMRPFHNTEVTSVCQGKSKSGPAQRDVAAALRHLNWRRCRI